MKQLKVYKIVYLKIECLDTCSINNKDTENEEEELPHVELNPKHKDNSWKYTKRHPKENALGNLNEKWKLDLN